MTIGHRGHWQISRDANCYTVYRSPRDTDRQTNTRTSGVTDNNTYADVNSSAGNTGVTDYD